MIQSFSQFESTQYSYFNPEEYGKSRLFSPYNNVVLGIENLLDLHESNSMVKYSLEEFKDLFRGPLLEGEGYVDEKLLESSYACYEFNSMYESRIEWFDNSEEALRIDSDNHIIFIKEGQAFIISKRSFEVIEDGILNEADSWWESAQAGWKNLTSNVTTFVTKRYEETKVAIKKTAKVVVNAVKATGEKVKQVGNKIKTAAINVWDTISSGAKKCYEWCKTVVAAVVKWVKEMSVTEKIANILTVLSALVGLAGTAIPGATIIAGVLMAAGGFLNIWDGSVNYYNAEKDLEKANIPVTDKGVDLAPTVKAISLALPKLVSGTIGIGLGLHEIGKGLTQALVNPAAGTVSLAVKGFAEKASKTWVGKFAMESALLNGLVENVVSKYITRMAPKIVGTPIGKAGAKGVAKLASLSIGYISFDSILGWLWKIILGLGSDVTKGISFLLSLPEKVTAGLQSMLKSDSTIIKILAAGINTIIGPIANLCSKLVNKYVKPIIQKIQDWFDNQVKSYETLDSLMKENKGKIPQEQVAQKSAISYVTPQKVEIKPGDVSKIKELPKTNQAIQQKAAATSTKKVKESLGFFGPDVLSFDEFTLGAAF